MIAIIDWLVSIFHGVTYWFGEIFNEAVKFTTAQWGLVLIAAGLGTAGYEFAVPAIYTCSGLLSGLSVGSWNFALPGPLATAFAIANTFTPMDELVSYLAAYLTLMLGLTIYRYAKTWLPEVFGWGLSGSA
jgi:hypothetical protein